jgi:hypothetical protein
MTRIGIAAVTLSGIFAVGLLSAATPADARGKTVICGWKTIKKGPMAGKVHPKYCCRVCTFVFKARCMRWKNNPGRCPS